MSYRDYNPAMLRRGVAPAALLLVALSTPQTGAAQRPPLPALGFDDLPAGVRTRLEHAYDAARTRPDDAAAVGRLGMLLHAYHQLRSADACYRAARALDPGALSWTYLSAVVTAELGDAAAALATLRDALRIDRTYLPARLRLAEALQAAGELDGSRAEYESIVREVPELAAAHYGLGRVLAALGETRDAVERYRHAVELAPEFGPAHYALALAYRDLDMAAQAEPHLAAHRDHGSRRPVPADPLLDEVRSLADTARELISEAARLGRLGRIDESIALHLKALERDPGAAQAHVNLISLYGRAGRAADAGAHYRAALALGSSVAEAHYNYGVLLASTRRLPEAAEAFRQALDVNPFHAQAHNNLGGLLAQAGRLDDAATHFRRALANDPQHRGARFNYGRVLGMQGRHRDAIDQLERILEPEDADTPRYLHALSGAWRQAGDVSKARDYAERARALAGRLGQAALAALIDEELKRLAQVPQ